MRTVNPYLIEAILAGMTGLADDDKLGLKLYESVDPNNQNQVKQVIRDYLKPKFMSGSYAYQQGIKTSLAYYLTTGQIDFESIYESCLPPFDPPTPARLFFEWVWQEYFPDQSYELDELGSYQEKPDIDESTRLFIKSGA